MRCETCGKTTPTAMGRPGRRAIDDVESTGRRYFGLDSQRILCARCLEDVRLVGTSVIDAQQPPLCAVCRDRLGMVWDAATLERRVASQSGGERVTLPGELVECSAWDVGRDPARARTQ